MSAHAKKVLAVSSGGGHWVQMKRLFSAFEGCRLSVATVEPGARAEVDCETFHLIRDASRWSKLALALSALQVLWVVLKRRPDVVVSTGAAPGFFAVWFGKLLGARTIWVDSIANAERLSLSGEKAGRHADLWLTQWPHLASEGGPSFRGSVL
jgi:UDP-N-acetylglucosamine:LPS N-acetylglucosamine transferase